MGHTTLQHRQTYRFAGRRVRVDAAVKYSITDLTRVFRCFVDNECTPAEPTFVIRRHKGKLTFGPARDNGSARNLIIDRGRVMPTVERAINQYVAAQLDDQLLLHAAAASWGDRAVVLPAAAGAGKTTLAAGLVRRGCGYLTDELVILDPRTGDIEPFPKALSLKEGSFGLFPSLDPEPTGPEFDRVWYLDPEQLRPGSIVTTPMPVGWVILPRFEAGATTRVEQLTIGQTVLGMFENSLNIARHKEQGLDRLIGIAQEARGHRLVFGDLEEACDVVLELLTGSDQRCP